MIRLTWLLCAGLLVCLGGIAWAYSRQSPPLPQLTFDYRAADVREKVQAVEAGLNMTSPQDWSSLAFFLRLYGFYPESSYCFEQASRMAQLDGDALYIWGTCLEQMGKLDAAHETISAAIAAGTQYEDYCWASLALLDLRRGKLAAAHKEFAKGSVVPYTRPFHVRYLMRTGRLDEAQFFVDDGLKNAPESIQLRALKARVAEQLGQTDVSKEYADLAMRGKEVIFEGDPAKHQTDRIDEMMGQSRLIKQAIELEAKQHYSEALAIMRANVDDEYWENHVVLLGDLEIRAGEPQRAIDLVNAAVDRGGASAALMQVLGDAYIQLGDFDAARTAWERGAGLTHDYKLYHRLSVLYDQQGLKDLAEQSRGMKAYVIGRESWLIEDFENAKKQLLIATEKAADFAHGWFYLAETYRVVGDLEAAAKAYQQCLSLSPTHGRAKAALAALASRS